MRNKDLFFGLLSLDFIVVFGHWFLKELLLRAQPTNFDHSHFSVVTGPTNQFWIDTSPLVLLIVSCKSSWAISIFRNGGNCNPRNLVVAPVRAGMHRLSTSNETDNSLLFSISSSPICSSSRTLASFGIVLKVRVSGNAKLACLQVLELDVVLCTGLRLSLCWCVRFLLALSPTVQ